jgi:hypothetical protein
METTKRKKKKPDALTPSSFERLGDYVESLWLSSKLTAEEKAELIRNAALRLLNGEELPEENAPNAGGRLTSHVLESDARELMGRPAIVARRMSREELLAARARLTGEPTGRDVLEADPDADEDNAE